MVLQIACKRSVGGAVIVEVAIPLSIAAQRQSAAHDERD
jgi:hypothetical protein